MVRPALVEAHHRPDVPRGVAATRESGQRPFTMEADEPQVHEARLATRTHNHRKVPHPPPRPASPPKRGPVRCRVVPSKGQSGEGKSLLLVEARIMR